MTSVRAEAINAMWVAVDKAIAAVMHQNQQPGSKEKIVHAKPHFPPT
jgi:hypothetical protein